MVMSENVGKLVGVVVVAVLVVVGVVATSGGDDVDFTRNAAFLRMPKAQQARLAPAFVEQAAPKSLDTGPIGQINKEVGPIFKGATGYKLKNVIVTSLEASVLEGRGVDGKGGTSSIRGAGGMHGKTCKAGTVVSIGANGIECRKAGIVASTGAHGLSGRKASIVGATGAHGVADRIAEWSRGGTDSIAEAVCKGKVVDSLKNVMITSYTAGAGDIASGYNCQDLQGNDLLPDDTTFPSVDEREAELLAACMESKVGDVFLKTHIESSATDCIATVLPTALPDRAKQLGTYWQTQQQITAAEGESG